MTITGVYGVDCTHANIAHLPNAEAFAGYITGSPDIVWTTQDWQRFPNGVRIDQSPFNTSFDETADVLDFENGAATVADIPGWTRNAWNNFHNAVRVGQREPCIYASQNSIPVVANALVAAGLTANLAIANYGLTRADAQAMVENASGPFPVVWVQYNDHGLYDEGIFSQSWLNNRSKKMPPTPSIPAPPGQWNDAKEWSWKEVMVLGVGLNGHLYGFVYDPVKNVWTQELNLPG